MTTDNAILGQVALGYSPFIDKSRAVTATRLTVIPLRPDAALDPVELLSLVASAWPDGGASVSLNVLSESLLQGLLRTQPSRNLILELPSFMAADAANAEALQALKKAGTSLSFKGRPVQGLSGEVLNCFSQTIVDIGDDWRKLPEAANPPFNSLRESPFVHAGVRRQADVDASFKDGASGVFGWPIEDEIAASAAGRSGAQTDLTVVVELIQRVDAQEPIEKIELTLKRDPSLAFKLMRYINSPAFGLRVEITSFRHAVMMLGYQRLKRWLALLLSTAGSDPNMKALMFAAVRRGLLMEELVRASGDEEMRNELFICGVFSLLDRMFKQPFGELLKTIPVPERVHQVLVEGAGPYLPYFNLVRAVEDESIYELRASTDALMMSIHELNQAVMASLVAAAQIE